MQGEQDALGAAHLIEIVVNQRDAHERSAMFPMFASGYETPELAAISLPMAIHA